MEILLTPLRRIDVLLITIALGGVMSHSNANFTNAQLSSIFDASPSLNVPVVSIPLPDGNGATTIRTATLPPWPQIANGPPEGWLGETG